MRAPHYTTYALHTNVGALKLDDDLANNQANLNNAIFFPAVILYNFFSFLLIYGGFGDGVLCWFLGLGFSVDGVWGLCVGPPGLFGLGLSI